MNLVQELLAKAATCESKTFKKDIEPFDSDLAEPVTCITYFTELDYDKMATRLSFREVYQKVDCYGKYGDSFSFLYLDERPVLMCHREGKYLRNYTLYKINSDILTEYASFMTSCIVSNEDDLEELTDDILTERFKLFNLHSVDLPYHENTDW